MVFVLSPCSKGTSRAQFVAFANGSVYPVPPLVVAVDPLPEKSSNADLELIHLDSGVGDLTLVGYSSYETNWGKGKQASSGLAQGYSQFSAVCLVEEFGALSN